MKGMIFVKKVLTAAFLLVAAMGFANNNMTVKTVKNCEVKKVKAQNYNMDGTRFSCTSNGVTYKFKESMVNFAKLEEGKEYDVEFTGREVDVDKNDFVSNLYLLNATLSK